MLKIICLVVNIYLSITTPLLKHILHLILNSFQTSFPDYSSDLQQKSDYLIWCSYVHHSCPSNVPTEPYKGLISQFNPNKCPK